MTSSMQLTITIASALLVLIGATVQIVMAFVKTPNENKDLLSRTVKNLQESANLVALRDVERTKKFKELEDRVEKVETENAKLRVQLDKVTDWAHRLSRQVVLLGGTPALLDYSDPYSPSEKGV